jgi:hypothetical protein
VVVQWQGWARGALPGRMVGWLPAGGGARDRVIGVGGEMMRGGVIWVGFEPVWNLAGGKARGMPGHAGVKLEIKWCRGKVALPTANQ